MTNERDKHSEDARHEHAATRRPCEICTNSPSAISIALPISAAKLSSNGAGNS